MVVMLAAAVAESVRRRCGFDPRHKYILYVYLCFLFS
jgi:hypothetical protein